MNNEVTIEVLYTGGMFREMKTFFETYYPEFASYLENDNEVNYQILLNNDIIGYMTLKFEYGTVGTVKNLVIHPYHRDRGHATKALIALAKSDECTKYISYININNLNSIKAALTIGAIIEGLTRNTDGKGSSYYLVGLNKEDLKE